jgi:uncharacterized membrane protein YeiH
MLSQPFIWGVSSSISSNNNNRSSSSTACCCFDDRRSVARGGGFSEVVVLREKRRRRRASATKALSKPKNDAKLSVAASTNTTTLHRVRTEDAFWTGCSSRKSFLSRLKVCPGKGGGGGSSSDFNVFAAKTTDDDGAKESDEEKQKIFDVHALKHFCALGVFFTGLLYIAYALLPHVGYTTAHPPNTENLMVKTFQSLSTLQAAEWLRFVDLFGTGVFAHGGVIAAGKRGLDLLGCVVVGCVTAMGGGTIRGALIGIEGAHPVFWIAEPEYLIVALVASFFTFFFWPKVLSKEVRESKAMETALNWLDALSLGGFCIIGANAALVRNLGPLLAVALSAITCTGGGVVRDVFLRQPVRVLHSHAELYGTTAIAGAAVYTVFACWFPGVSHNLRCLLAASTTVFLRWRAWKRGLKLPMYSDVNPDFGDYISIAQRDV